jgi:TolA-binding protein
MEKDETMRLLVALVMAMALVFAGPARAQVESREGIALQNQILELRRDLQNLRNDQGRGSSPSSSYGSSLGGRSQAPAAGGGAIELTATLLDRVSQLEDQVRQLNGRIDELSNTQQRQNADLAKQIADLQFRLDNTPAAGGARPPAAIVQPSQAPANLGTLPVGNEPPPPPPVKRTPELALQEGNAALARRDYAGAEASAREVLAAAKATPRGYDAQFLLAQAKAGQKDYANAALAYNDAYTRNKTGARAQDSLIGLAASLVALNQKPAACGALDTLRAQFPQPRPDIAPREASIRAASGCRP